MCSLDDLTKFVTFYTKSTSLHSCTFIQTVGGTGTSFGQFSYLCTKGSKEALIYIVQSERTTNSRAKMKGVFSSFKHGVPSTEESAGHNLTSRHALGASTRSLAVGNSEIYALLLNNGL